MNLKFFFFLLFPILVCAQSTEEIKMVDSLIILRGMSNDKNIDLNLRLDYANRALDFARNNNLDTSEVVSYRDIARIYLNSGNYELYRDNSKEYLKSAKKINDSLAIASAYFNIGQYYYINYKTDSAYLYFSKSVKLYDQLKKKERKASVLLNISDIQDTEKDYYGSEENAIKSMRIYETLPKSENNLDNLWILNNLLGILSLKQGNFDKSLDYHNTAKKYSQKMRDGFYNEIFSINNIAFVYRKKGNYKKSLDLYKELIDTREEYDEYDPTFYPLVLDNYAFTKLVAGHDDYEVMEAFFIEAFEISDKLDDPITKLQISIDLSKFYLQRNKRDLSLKYANISYTLAKETSSNEILLDALKVLSELKDGEEGKKYLKEHIKLSDSLLTVERNVRNKFARIEFETDQLEEANEKMSEQLMWLLAISGGLLITLFLLYIIITQRARNKELKFEQDQQKANEEIYNLMLSQQDKVDEARANEKKRISEELHDGILGRLFGTRLSLDSLNFSEGQDAIKNRATYIKELMTIENDIRKVSHDLNTDFVSGSGFMDIVSELIEKQTIAYQLDSSFDYTDDINWESVPNKTKINIYRIIQESLQNIYKHANANSVKISIQLKNNVICLSIIDDGDGFDVNKSKKGIGLKNINSRVNEVAGKAEFNSILKEGTEVSITIPYKN